MLLRAAVSYACHIESLSLPQEAEGGGDDLFPVVTLHATPKGSEVEAEA